MYDHIKYCPECGKELEIHPIVRTRSCFVHGDFLPFGEEFYHWDSFQTNRARRNAREQTL